ncbi:MAG: hypothetical protein ACLR78_03630 [Roseburia sp.]
MAKERQNFVYGNAEEGVKGCIANGIDEKTANQIYDDMTDFAKYAFNKSHAAAYAVVCLSDGVLKYLLSEGIYGGAYDLRDGQHDEGLRVYPCLPEHGNFDPAAGYQRRIQRASPYPETASATDFPRSRVWDALLWT